MPAFPNTKAVFSGLSKNSSWPIFHAPCCEGDQSFTVFFYGIRNDLKLPRGAGVVATDGIQGLSR